MRKPAFLTNERLSRLLVSFLLCAGLLMPLLFSFGVGGAAGLSLAAAAAVLALCAGLGGLKRGRLILGAAAAAICAVQLALPGMGMIGGAVEAFKALLLYLSGVPGAARLFSTQVGLTLGVCVAAVSYAFSSRSVGFLPATLVTVLMLFGMWSLGKAQYLWLALPALAALLLLVSQTSHEKVNLFEVLPMAAAVVGLAMLLLPSGQTTIPPLYKAAMELKQTISDYLFFTEPRNVFTLGAYGYYPQGNARLGGPAEPSEYPVMTVKTDQRTLMRAVVKDEYTGRSWRDTSSGKRYLYVSPRWSKLRETVFLENMPSGAVRAASTLLDEHAVSVQMQNTATSTLFTPMFLRRFSPQGSMVAYFNDASELFTTRDLQRGDRYTVFTPILEGGGVQLGALIDAAPKGNDANYSLAMQTYMQLPEHLLNSSDAQRMLRDVNNMVSESATPYEKACAIMRHLQRYYRYTLTPDAPPETQDFVTYFLYVGKEGYCTYFASAMTVLCRMAGLPARYVEGFVAQPGADGFAYVTGLDAHAWTEVYFEGFGWVPFDATPIQQSVEDQNGQDEQEPEPDPTPTPTPEPPDENEDNEPTPSPEPPQDNPPDEPEDPETPPEEDADKPPFPWWWLLLAAALAALIARIVLRMPDRVAARQQTDADRIFVYGSAAFTVMRLNKRAPAPGETPLLFARRMDRQKAFPTPVLPLWRMMAMSHYSRVQPGPEHTARARECFWRLYKPQKPLKKLRFMLAAAFGKGCYTCLDTPMAHVEPEKRYTYAFKQEKKGREKGVKKRPAKKNGKTSAAQKAGKPSRAAQKGGRSGAQPKQPARQAPPPETERAQQPKQPQDGAPAQRTAGAARRRASRYREGKE
ncbi:MAG: DUF3488 and transglutaminase-like domain-containing protein [Clostridiales bacterium]|nr:DUF3488 and transglutaminase-like domain-containing protein [Clostridiales bacterium]